MINIFQDRPEASWNSEPHVSPCLSIPARKPCSNNCAPKKTSLPPRKYASSSVNISSRKPAKTGNRALPEQAGASMYLTQLDERLWFPDPAQALAEPEGLLAIGGDLSPPRLLLAYRMGIFPWFDNSQPLLWWSPNPRAVLEPDRLHVSRSLAKLARRGRYRLSVNLAFDEVIHQCRAQREARQGTWITP